MHGVLLTVHILAATIWTGGHLVLSMAVLPQVLRDRSPQRLLEFETAYERIGMPALIVQIATGLFLAFNIMPDISAWFDVSNPVSRVIMMKLVLLVITLGFALDARFRVIPKLSQESLTDMAWHIIPVTVVSVLFVVVGVSFRTGWFF